MTRTLKQILGVGIVAGALALGVGALPYQARAEEKVYDPHHM